MGSEERFYTRAKEYVAKEADLVDLFIYYLCEEEGERHATALTLANCFAKCDLPMPRRLAAHLSEGLKSMPRRLVKTDGGYRLFAGRREQIGSLLGTSKPAVVPAPTLNKLEALIPSGPKRDFLHEAILCFAAGATRAAVVMVWNLALHHLQDHVLADAGRLAEFNAALAASTDRRVKVKSVSKQDDFTEMPESLFLLFCRQARVITSSVSNKLEGRLSERNAAAHPSGVKVGPSVAQAYVEDLVDNVVLKYQA